MTTEADIGYGASVEISTDGGATWTTIAEMNDVTPPPLQAPKLDATHFGSPGATKEFIVGLVDPGDMTMDMAFNPGSSGDVQLQALLKARTKIKVRIPFRSGETWSYDAYVTGYEATVPLEDKMTASVTFGVTGVMSITSALAPANIMLPAVSGIAQDGQVLSALTGVWLRAPAFTYQWQEDSGGWANILGATAETYTVVTGDVGAAIRVIVTATNGAGSTSATSAATADVIAA